jgi:hypothetical protein
MRWPVMDTHTPVRWTSLTRSLRSMNTEGTMGRWWSSDADTCSNDESPDCTEMFD